MIYLTNLFKHWAYKLFAPGVLLREKYEAFRALLEKDKRSHELVAELQQHYYDQITVDFAAIEAKCEELSSCVSQMVQCLMKLCPTCYLGLWDYFRKIDFYVKLALSRTVQPFSPPFVLWLEKIDRDAPPSLTGNKALNLSVAKNLLGQNVPDGFVVTANAFNYFMEANDLRAEIESRLALVDIRDMGMLERVSAELQEIIGGASVPEPIVTEISGALSTFQEHNSDGLRFCVRSSAVGEDSRNSYAGQYQSHLNVPMGEVVDSYKRVIASKYSPGALHYRISRGELDPETPMAVLVLRMVDAKASGIVYTRDPTDRETNKLFIHVVEGLGSGLVEGSVSSEVIKAAKTAPHRLEKSEDAQVEADATVGPKRGDPSGETVLTDGLAKDLVQWALQLENSMGYAQDIEWCLDNLDQLYIVQSRPLVMETSARRDYGRLNTPAESAVLLKGGIRASGGIAVGVVWNIEAGDNLTEVPGAAVLVAGRALPHYAIVMDRINALVTDVGSNAGHLVAIARELGVPALVNTGSASEILATGRTVTVDADSMTIYEGAVQLPESSQDAGAALRPAETPFGKRLEKALKHISKLNLVDPKSGDFLPESCRTFHDIVRFCHEKSIHEMFTLGEPGSRGARSSKRLKSQVPIVVYLLDVGGGLEGKVSEGKEVTIDAILSRPFRKVWKGLTHPDIIWRPEVAHFNWKEFDRFSHGLIRPDSVQLASYAVVSNDYLNFHIHFGYHFVIVDSLCSDEPEDNYIMVRFAGGGGEPTSRFMRVQFLEEVFSRLGFEVEKKGDLIDAQMNKCECDRIGRILESVGILLGCTRLLDLSLKDRSEVHELVERYFSGDYTLSPIR